MRLAILPLFMLLASAAYAESSPGPLPALAPEPVASPKPRSTQAASARTAVKGPAPKAVKQKSDLPPLLQEVEAKYEKSPTLVAKFTQLIHAATTGVTKKNLGGVMFKRPNKFRWEILQPDPSISVSNGTKAWHYTPPFDEGDQGQVVVTAASRMRTRMASALLSGSFSAIRGMKIRQVGPASFSLVPRPGSTNEFKKATIQVDASSKLITGIKLDEKSGNQSEITLSNIQLGKDLPDSVFNFVPPPNTALDKE